MKKIFIIAGEASGDLHAANLVREIKARHPDIQIIGMGGKKMAEAGVTIFQPNNLSFIGLTEVILNFRRIYAVFQKIKNFLLQQKPDLVILVDYPSFNLRMAKIAKKAGLKVFYYISPQLWAWHQSRVNIIKQYIDTMAVVFPFEVDFYKKFDINAKFVGHPLANTVKPSITKEQALKLFGINNNNIHSSSLNPQSAIHNPIIGLLPGSRRGEIRRLLPIMAQAAKILKNKFPAAQFVLPLAPTLSTQDLTPYLDEELNIKIISGNTYDLVNLCDAAIVTSGTATLEVALLNVPMAIVYRASWLTALIARMVIKVPFLGICNIIAGKEIVKEFLQNNAKPELVAPEIIKILTDKKYQEDIKKDLAAVSEKLTCQSSDNAAELAIDNLFLNPVELSNVCRITSHSGIPS